jgi:hypothetical protein
MQSQKRKCAGARVWHASNQGTTPIFTAYQPPPDADDGTQRRQVAQVFVLLICPLAGALAGLEFRSAVGRILAQARCVFPSIFFNLTLVPQFCADIRI